MERKKTTDQRKPTDQKRTYDPRKPMDQKKSFDSRKPSIKKEETTALAPEAGEPEQNTNRIIGRNPVHEAIKSGHEIDKIIAQKDAEGSIRKILSDAKDRKIPIHYVDKISLDRICDSRGHQGIAAYVSPYDYVELDDIIEQAKAKGEDLFVVILDGVEDPHNLGAIIRTANAAGAHGIIIPKRRAASITDTVVKASAGAIEYTPVARVSNIVQTIEKLKAMGAFIAAVDLGGQLYHKANLKGKIALVLGGEGEGIGRLVGESCDFKVSIPMAGEIESLNASNAAAVLMYEVQRQRHL
jgi:23S rRNA (guanosine2251-2'-O)-methyltransferase